ncbi:MAG: conjugal transfer protein TraG [Gammaproteobacteria bacterium]|nr:conjugal transfer protein TraG [Gammaproteobacteria bacterium]
MAVTGYLALYTTLIGWQQYQQLWNLMVGVGLVFIPFIGMVLKGFLEPYESQEPKNAAVITLRRLLIQVVGALIIIEFCCVPTIPLNPKVLHFQPLCVHNAAVATPGHTGTRYDNQFAVPTGVKVPILWYFVMAISNGFTVAASEGLSCSPIDYQTLQNQLDVSNIHDVALKKMTIRFYNACYVPAYSRYLSGNLTESQQAMSHQIQQQYGQSDLRWLGSQTFLQTPGFYDVLFAKQPVTGFPFNPDRDQFAGQVPNHSQWGEPSCRDWWQDSEHGLHHQLQQALPASFLQSIVTYKHPQQLADMGIRSLIQHTFDPGMNSHEISRSYESLNDSHALGIGSDMLAKIGTDIHQLSYYPGLYLLINALPVIQALVLMILYALLALFIPFSSYRLHFIITGAMMIFAVTFWSYLWHLVANLNNYLIGALYPIEAGISVPHDPSMGVLLQNGGGFEKTFVQFIIALLYIILPIIFFGMMSWVGIKGSNTLNNVLSSSQGLSDDVGRESAATLRLGLNAVVKALKPGKK